MIAKIVFAYDIPYNSRTEAMENQTDEALDEILMTGMEVIKRRVPKGVAVFVTNRRGETEEL